MEPHLEKLQEAAVLAKEALSFVPKYPVIGYALVASWAIGAPYVLLAVFRSGGPSRSWLATVLGVALATTIAGLTLQQQQEPNLFMWHVIGMSVAVFGFQPAAVHSILSKHSFTSKEARESRVWAHKLIQMAVVGSVSAAFAAIYLNKPAGFPGKHFMSVHSLVGLLAIALMAGNTLQASYMQGSIFSPKLAWVSRLHRLMGACAFVASFFAAGLGLFNRTVVVDWTLSPIKFSLPSTWHEMGGWSLATHGANRTWAFIGTGVLVLLLLLFPGTTPKPRKAKK